MDPIATVAANFLKYDYPTSLDMAKSFLTLISAILVFTITFSDKIIDFPKSDRLTRLSLMSSWFLFIGSVLLCGVSVCILFAASYIAAHVSDHASYRMPREDFIVVAFYGWALMTTAGLTFVCGLACFVGSAVQSIKSSQRLVTASGKE